MYSRLSHWATFSFIETQVCEHSIWPPTEYMDCGGAVTAAPTELPTPNPTESPTESPTEEDAAEPTEAPTTAALREFLAGTSSNSANSANSGNAASGGGNMPETDDNIFDDAFFFDNEDEAQSVNGVNAQTSSGSSSNLWRYHGAISLAVTLSAMLLMAPFGIL